MSTANADASALPSAIDVQGALDSFNRLGLPVKVMIGATCAVAFLDGGILALAVHTVAGWAAYKISDNLAAKRLTQTIAGLEDMMEEIRLLDKNSPEIRKLKDLVQVYEADRTTIRISSILIGIAAFINPLLGVGILGAAYGVHHVVHKDNAKRLEKFRKEFQESLDAAKSAQEKAT